MTKDSSSGNKPTSSPQPENNKTTPSKDKSAPEKQDKASAKVPSETSASEKSEKNKSSAKSTAKKQMSNAKPDKDLNSSTEDKNKTTKTEETNQAKATDLPERPADNHTIEKARKPISIGLVLCLLLALSAVILSGWIGYSQWNNQQKQAQQLSQQNTDIDDQKQRLARLQNTISLQSQSTQQTNQSLEEVKAQSNLLRQQLAVTQDKLRIISSQGKQEWLLEQAHYYLTLAQEKLLFENNRSTAMALLAQADDTLKQTSDLNLTHIRQAISDDLTYLDGLTDNNNTDLLLQLASLQKQIPQLAPMAYQLPENQNFEPEQHKAWFDRLMQTLDQFGEDAFKYRTHDEKVQPLLTEQQLTILQSALQLTLSHAQTAVLENNQPYYVSRLQSAQETIQQYFQLNQQGTAIVNQLQQLSQQSLGQQIDYSLQSLPLLMEEKEQRRLKWYSEQQQDLQQGDQP